MSTRNGIQPGKVVGVARAKSMLGMQMLVVLNVIEEHNLWKLMSPAKAAHLKAHRKQLIASGGPETVAAFRTLKPDWFVDQAA